MATKTTRKKIKTERATFSTTKTTGGSVKKTSPKSGKKSSKKGRAAKKKTKVSSSWKRFSKALQSGKLPKNAVTRKLSQYFGTSGKPLKHKLRSEAAREEFNRLLKQYNKQRMTQAKQEQKRQGIREKQLETHRRNLMPDQAAEGLSQYEKALDILETVADDINSKVKYEQIKEILMEAPELTPEEIVDFIKESYERIQNELPDFAKMDDEQKIQSAVDDIRATIQEVGTTDMRDLRYAFTLKDMNPAEYEAWLEDRW